MADQDNTTRLKELILAAFVRYHEGIFTMEQLERVIDRSLLSSFKDGEISQLRQQVNDLKTKIGTDPAIDITI